MLMLLTAWTTSAVLVLHGCRRTEASLVRGMLHSTQATQCSLRSQNVQGRIGSA